MSVIIHEKLSPCSGGMRDDVATNWFLGVSGEHGRTINLRHNLISYHDSHAKLHTWQGTLRL